jgi:penicillin-binding protein 2
VFKIITALAGLESGELRPGSSFLCRGGMKFGNREFRCWKKGGHGEIALHRALVESCDVYFYQAGLKIGIDAIARVAEEFGVGQPTGLGIGAEAPGLVPSTAWKRRARGEPWYPGETLSAAIGQGYDLVTPIQMAHLAAILANGGVVYRPHVVRRVTDLSGRFVSIREPSRSSGRPSGGW